jgi:hypothetical protein
MGRANAGAGSQRGDAPHAPRDEGLSAHPAFRHSGLGILIERQVSPCQRLARALPRLLRKNSRLSDVDIVERRRGPVSDQSIFSGRV